VSSIFQLLADNEVLLLFLLIGIGMVFGHIKVKGISLGAAAVLFFAIVLTAWAKAEGYELSVGRTLGTMGLALFAFAIGINSGPNFFHTIRNSVTPILLMVGVLALGGGIAQLAGKAMGMDQALIAGTFSGAITNTPALSAAGAASGDPATATVGYSIAYLFGVIGMLAFAMLALNYGKNDKDKPTEVVNRTIRVERTDRPSIADFQHAITDNLQFSRLRRGETGPIWIPETADRLHHDDLVTVVGSQADVDRAIEYLGHGSSHSLMSDRRFLDFRRITVSNPKLAGQTVGDVDLETNFGASMSRLRRGDTDMLATHDLVLQMGDRVRVVAPTAKMAEISKLFGDSTKGMTSINPVALGIGMVLGILLGSIQIPLGGGDTFSIGSAAGTLIVGLIMGRVGRIGTAVTALPYTACMVMSELGLLIFLAHAGTNAGGQIMTAFTSGEWTKILFLGVIITLVVAAGLYFSMRYIGKMGGTKLAGALGGTQTQPAVLAFANARTGDDPRVAMGYAMVYPVAMIVKIFVAQILGSL